MKAAFASIGIFLSLFLVCAGLVEFILWPIYGEDSSGRNFLILSISHIIIGIALFFGANMVLDKEERKDPKILQHKSHVLILIIGVFLVVFGVFTIGEGNAGGTFTCFSLGIGFLFKGLSDYRKKRRAVRSQGKPSDDTLIITETPILRLSKVFYNSSHIEGHLFPLAVS